MSNDTYRIFEATLYLHYAWFNPIFMLAILIMLASEIGIVAASSGELTVFFQNKNVTIYESRLLLRIRRICADYTNTNGIFFKPPSYLRPKMRKLP